MTGPAALLLLMQLESMSGEHELKTPIVFKEFVTALVLLLTADHAKTSINKARNSLF